MMEQEIWEELCESLAHAMERNGNVEKLGLDPKNFHVWDIKAKIQGLYMEDLMKLTIYLLDNN